MRKRVLHGSGALLLELYRSFMLAGPRSLYAR